MLRKCYLCPGLPVSRIVDMSVEVLFVCLESVFLRTINHLQCNDVILFGPDPQRGAGDFGRKTLPYFKLV